MALPNCHFLPRDRDLERIRDEDDHWTRTTAHGPLTLREEQTLTDDTAEQASQSMVSASHGEPGTALLDPARSVALTDRRAPTSAVEAREATPPVSRAEASTSDRKAA